MCVLTSVPPMAPTTPPAMSCSRRVGSDDGREPVRAAADERNDESERDVGADDLRGQQWRQAQQRRRAERTGAR